MTIFSCSMFYSEFDLLKIKLESLKSVVDYFLISESDFTHSGKPKELFLSENIDNDHRFDEFQDNLLIQVIRDTPSEYENLKEDTNADEGYNLCIRKVNQQKRLHQNLPHYGRDCFEKESLIRGLIAFGAKDDDIVLLSDLDEIVRPEAVQKVLKDFNPEIPYFFHHDTYYYYLNLQVNEESYGTVMLTFKKFKEMSHSELRANHEGILIPNGGCHFTYLGNQDMIKTKIESFSHQEFNRDAFKNNLESVVEKALNGKDLYGRNRIFKVVPITKETHPSYLVDHLDDFKEFIYEPK